MARATATWTNTDTGHFEAADLIRTNYLLEEVLQNIEHLGQLHNHGDASAGGDTIAAGAITTATVTGSGSALTIPDHEVVAGDNRLLIVRVAVRSESGAAQWVSGITFGGVALTMGSRSRAAAGASAEIWYLIAPAVSTADVVVTLEAAEDAIIGEAQNFTGVNQVTAIGDTSEYDNAGDDAPTVDVTSASGQMVLDALGTYDSPTVAATTAGGGQTQDSNLTETGSTGQIRLSTSHEAGAGTVTMSWATSGAPIVALAAIALLTGAAISSPGGKLVLNEPEEMLFRMGA